MAELEPEQIVRLEEDGPAVVLLDQRKLPDDVVEVRCTTAEDVANAIRGMVVRGAPAIGIAAAYGVALAGLRGDDLAEAEHVLAASRPTAVNLPWALARMRDEPTPERARALHEEQQPSYDLLRIQVNPIPIKAALNLTGHEVGGHRLPMVDPDGDELAQIRSCLERAGLLAAPTGVAS